MNLDQIKKDLEEFREGVLIRHAIHLEGFNPPPSCEERIIKHLEELIAEATTIKSQRGQAMSPCRKCRENISCGDGTELCRKCQAKDIFAEMFAEMFAERRKEIIAEVESSCKLVIDQLKKAEEVIRFYADINNHQTPSGKMGVLTDIVLDRGQKAREYLNGMLST